MNKVEGFLIVESSTTASFPNILQHNANSTIFEAKLQDAEAPNRNKRIYDRTALYNGLNSQVIKEKLERKTFYGEAGHPLSDDIKRQTYIDQRNISHIITKIDFRNNDIFGTVETANTACGKDMQGLIRQGSEVSFSMRGLGNVVKKEGEYVRVCDPLMVICYDWVVFPSHPEAYITRKLSENMELIPSEERAKQILTEGTMINFNMKELLSYITESSKQVKELSESFEMGINKDMSNIALDEHNMLSIKEGNDTLKVFLEESLKKEIDSFIKNL